MPPSARRRPAYSPASPSACSPASPAGRCGWLTLREWVGTAPRSPTAASLTSGAFMRRPRESRIR
ncbi:hypothetical protein FZI91_17630 [Mycobacterium sp. CBMA271]|nr:hypothetical protein [Mycobacteroides sp. CBMA 271]